MFTILQRNVLVSGVVLIVLMPVCAGCKRATVAAPRDGTAAVDPWKEAVSKVEHDRGEPMGRDAVVSVPKELKHYADHRRFLAVQAADSQAQVGAIPHDFAALVLSIQRHELVELRPLGDDYLLYGVGQNAEGEPFKHYDRPTRQDVPLATSEEQFREELSRVQESLREINLRLESLEGELRRVPRRDRKRRAALAAELSRTRRLMMSAKARNKLITAFQADPLLRASLSGEYQLLLDLARDFDGEVFDLNDADARRRFKIRLLSFIRAEARDVLFQIARGYNESFGRLLPISSLIRPEQYQRELVGVNSNAARGSAPPHSTGLAFDIYYGYMSAAEQEYLMSEIARLKVAGRVEALREARDNIHVYVFAKGRRPDEKLIARAIEGKRARVTLRKAAASSRR